MRPCEHPNAHYVLGSDWIYRCPEPPNGCGAEGAGHSPEAAERSMRVNHKCACGERLTPAEENVRAFTPFPWGTAAGCASRGVRIDFGSR